MREIVFIRHAATDLAGTFCGQLDPPVNAVGMEQIARLIGSDFIGDIESVSSSDLHRARATAEAIAVQARAPITFDAAWREIAFGTWEGLTWAQIERLEPVYARQWAEEFPRLPALDGEHYSAFSKRVLQAVHALRQRDFERIAVVTHAGVMRVVLQELCEVEAARAWELSRDYCGGFSLLADNSFRALTSHDWIEPQLSFSAGASACHSERGRISATPEGEPR